jgi:hypothetical protein
MQRTFVAIVLAAALVLAGCAGPGGEGVNNTSNDTDGALANDTGGLGDDANDTGGDAAVGTDSVTGDDASASVAVADA